MLDPPLQAKRLVVCSLTDLKDLYILKLGSKIAFSDHTTTRLCLNTLDPLVYFLARAHHLGTPLDRSPRVLGPRRTKVELEQTFECEGIGSVVG